MPWRSNPNNTQVSFKNKLSCHPVNQGKQCLKQGQLPPSLRRKFLMRNHMWCKSWKSAPVPPTPPPAPSPEGNKPNFRAIGILILVIIPILVGLVLAANILSGSSASHANTTPAITVPTSIRTRASPDNCSRCNSDRNTRPHGKLNKDRKGIAEHFHRGLYCGTAGIY